MYWLTISWKALSIIRTERISIVHPHTPKICLFLGIPAKLLGKKVVLTLEGDPIAEADQTPFVTRLSIRFVWWLSRKIADRVCPNSLWLEKKVKERHRDITSKTSYVHNPIDYDRFATADGSSVKEELGVDGPMVFTPARLHPAKGLDILLKAIPEVLKKNPNVTFVIAGQGPQKESLQHLIQQFGLSKNVIMLGFRVDTDKLTAACDLLLLPSRYEPFGMPAAEAGASSKPTVVTNTGGLPEIVQNETTGYVVPVDKPEALAHAVLRLLESPAARTRLGASAKKRVESLFTPSATAKKIETIYNQVARTQA